MKHIVITGVSRGIGEKLMQLSLERGDKVYGIARDPSGSKSLTLLQEKYKDSLHIFSGDVNDPDLSEKITGHYPWKKIDILINNAGVYSDDNWKDFEKTFLTNSIAPYFLTKGLFSLLRNSEDPRAVFISSQMGSIEDNSSGGSVSYRASKSALNMIVKCLAIDEKWLTSLIFHPGWVRTRMGGENAPTEADDSAQGLLALIHSSGKKETGSFRDFKGRTIAW